MTELINELKKIAAKATRLEVPHYCIGRRDVYDAYADGIHDGEIQLARDLLKQL